MELRNSEKRTLIHILISFLNKISGCRANVRIRLYLFCGNNVIVTFNSFNCYFSMKIWLGWKTPRRMKPESVGYLHIESQGIGNVECPVLVQRFQLDIFFEDKNKELEEGILICILMQFLNDKCGMLNQFYYMIRSFLWLVKIPNRSTPVHKCPTCTMSLRE